MKNFLWYLGLIPVVWSCSVSLEKSSSPDDDVLSSSTHESDNSALATVPDSSPVAISSTSSPKNSVESTNTIVLYGNPGCVFCDAAVRFLEDRHVSFEFNDVRKDPSLLSHLRATVGSKRFPYVFYNGDYVGGLAELKTLVSTSKEFNQMSHGDH